MVADINNPELTNPWDNIKIIDASHPYKFKLKIASEQKPMWATDEYAINLFISICLIVKKTTKYNT